MSTASPARGVDFVGQLRAVLFTADDSRSSGCAIEPPQLPRRRVVAGRPQLLRATQRYARIMQQRNATLRRIREGIAGVDELGLWDDTFAREGST